MRLLPLSLALAALVITVPAGAQEVARGFAIAPTFAAGATNTTQLRFRSRSGTDPAEWPEDLRVRQMPTPLP